MPSKEDKGKKRDIDPDTGEERMHGHHHKHRSRRGQKKRGRTTLAIENSKKAREKLDPSDKRVRRTMEDVPLKGRNRNAKKTTWRRPPQP